jgi:hypothetical protein
MFPFPHVATHNLTFFPISKHIANISESMFDAAIDRSTFFSLSLSRDDSVCPLLAFGVIANEK